MQESFAWEFRVNCSSMLFQMKSEMRLTPRCASFPALALDQETIRLGAHEHPARALLLRHNRPANLAGVPAVSVPCGFTRSGLPTGLQIMGGVSSEPLLLRIAKIFERSQPQHRRPPV